VYKRQEEKVAKERAEIRTSRKELFEGKSEFECRVIEMELKEDEHFFDQLQEMEKEDIIKGFVNERRNLLNAKKEAVKEVVDECVKLNQKIFVVQMRHSHMYGPIRNLFWRVLVFL